MEGDEGVLARLRVRARGWGEKNGGVGCADTTSTSGGKRRGAKGGG